MALNNRISYVDDPLYVLLRLNQIWFYCTYCLNNVSIILTDRLWKTYFFHLLELFSYSDLNLPRLAISYDAYPIFTERGKINFRNSYVAIVHSNKFSLFALIPVSVRQDAIRCNAISWMVKNFHVETFLSLFKKFICFVSKQVYIYLSSDT